MSVVIMHVVKNNLFLCGDKKQSIVESTKDNVNEYTVTSINDTIKVFKPNNTVVFGVAGGGIGYGNLLGEILDEDRTITPEFCNWDYLKFKQYLDYRQEHLCPILEQKTNIGLYAKAFRLILCGIKENKFFSSLYQYPTVKGSEIYERSFDLNTNTFIVLSQIRYEEMYTTEYQKSINKQVDFSLSSIVNGFNCMLKKCSELDKSISTTSDAVSITIKEV